MSSVSDYTLKVLDPVFFLLNLAFLIFDPTQKGLIQQLIFSVISTFLKKKKSFELLDQLFKR